MTDHALQHIHSLPSWLTGRVAARGRELLARSLAAEGLRLSQYAVLAAVAEHGPAAQADLVRRLHIDRKDVVGLLNDLERDDLVRRRPDPADGRKNAVSVTDRGKDTLRRCAALAEQANQQLLEPLSATERELLITLLARLQNAHTTGEPAEGDQSQ
ncbi:MarR family winged helix-turn-helix transcriptional regulator [Saccharopolyspora flava]|uniref:DNA-binding transcriptional regulator, MarR family n=1 Tax=Saccharopolyspora flava TaxID=95161 RepID=A0A1I6SWN9_9PSEU|nr:MarR family transcriptional regulator [Saccharopolyspora flava]SFS81329.1 DNA-binding transcriptional regulator, MarR family [Saccharopolyspora flava]